MAVQRHDGISAVKIRRWIRGRRARSGHQRPAWEGVYTGGFAIIFLLASLLLPLHKLAMTPELREQGVATGWVLATTVLCWSGALLAGSVLGPMSASLGALSWVATSPVSRRALLLPRYVATMSACAASGLPAVILVVPRLSALSDLLAALTVVMCGGLIVGSGMVIVQSLTDASDRLFRMVATVAGTVAIAPIMVRGQPWSVPWELPHRFLMPVTVLLAAAAVAIALVRLDAVPLSSLRSAAVSTTAAVGGATASDPSLWLRVSEDRRWRRAALRGHLRIPRGVGAVVVHDALSLVRMPMKIVVMAVLTVLPLLGLSLPRPGVNASLGWLACALLAGSQLTGNARYDADRPAILRLIGVTDRWLLRSRSITVTFTVLGWSSVAGGLLATQTGCDWVAGAALGAAAGPALAAGALRAARRSLIRHDYPLIVTPMGVIPSGPVLWLAQGVDIALLGTLPALDALANQQFDATAIVSQLCFSMVTLGCYLVLRPERRKRRLAPTS
jgi:hypothetical protein